MTEAEAQVWTTGITVAGTLLGAVAGALGTWLVEKRRRDHEDRHRHSESRRSLYGEVLRAVDGFLLESGMMVHHHGDWTPFSIEAFAGMKAQSAGIMERISEVALLATRPAVIDAAQDLRASLAPSVQSMADLLDATRQSIPEKAAEGERARMVAALSVVSKARSTFIAAARDDLRITVR